MVICTRRRYRRYGKCVKDISEGEWSAISRQLSAEPRSKHKRFVHFVTESDKSPLPPFFKGGAETAPFRKGGRAQRGGISARLCANVLWSDLDKGLMVFATLIGRAVSRACLLFVGCIVPRFIGAQGAPYLVSDYGGALFVAFRE